MIREHMFTEIVTYECVMWRKSYASGTFKVLVEETESDELHLNGKGKIVQIIEAERPRLNDDYTDLHGGIDSLTRSTTLEEVKKLFEGKEGTFMHYEKSIPPTHRFTLKDQFPIEIKPVGLPF
ncbi:MAG: hypothetical protein QFX35_03400 [Candidatus Verstraetearchaeota archaeon]|nr:hypothetical protein [Candidatus Verstraetearchaeota archaeon]